MGRKKNRETERKREEVKERNVERVWWGDGENTKKKNTEITTKEGRKKENVRIAISGERPRSGSAGIYLLSFLVSKLAGTVASQKHAAIFSREHLLGVPYDVCV